MARGDMFLKLESAKQGPIKGESQDETHKDEIDVVSWSWGMHARTALGGAGPTGKTTLDELNVVKRVDSASTPLMAALRNNDVIKKGVLTVRKAGGSALEYFKITIEKGRVTGLDVRSGAGGDEEELVEELKLSFQKIGFEYTPQGPDGNPRGSMLFETDTGE
jgi:type VI secretion system secreted protein Hcp